MLWLKCLGTRGNLCDVCKESYARDTVLIVRQPTSCSLRHSRGIARRPTLCGRVALVCNLLKRSMPCTVCVTTVCWWSTHVLWASTISLSPRVEGLSSCQLYTCKRHVKIAGSILVLIARIELWLGLVSLLETEKRQWLNRCAEPWHQRALRDDDLPNVLIVQNIHRAKSSRESGSWVFQPSRMAQSKGWSCIGLQTICRRSFV